jgi:VanZ family protein
MTTKLVLKVSSVAALVLLIFVALGPAEWQPRSGIGFEIDHFVGYFIFTLMFCLAWPQPLLVGGALTVLAVVLENLQSFLPDRSSYFVAALYSAAGVRRSASASLPTDLESAKRSSNEPPPLIKKPR